MWDGSGSIVDRVDAEEDSYNVFETRLSIAGGIQPGIFRQVFSHPDDPQGIQARFLYAVAPVKKALRVKGYCQLSDILPDLYQWLDNIPTGMVKLSPAADRHYTNLVEQIGDLAEIEPTQAIRAWMRKLPGQLLRIALGLHLLECYFDRNKNLWSLEVETLDRAVEAGRYYRSAFQVVQEKVADSDSISSILLKIWDLAVTSPEGITPRDAYRAIWRDRPSGRRRGTENWGLCRPLVHHTCGNGQGSNREKRALHPVFCPPQSQSSVISQQSTVNKRVRS